MAYTRQYPLINDVEFDRNAWESIDSLAYDTYTNLLLAPTSPIPFPRDVVQQTIFASGHGFTAAAGSTGTQADDTSEYIYGSQSVKLTTTGSNGFQALKKTGMTALDATARYLSITVKVDHPERLADLRLDVSSDAFVNWSSGDNISPSTNITSPYFVPNRWITLLIPWAGFTVGGGAGATRSALTGFQVRCKDNGSGPINMWVNKISAVAEPANAVCTFTFDDGYASQFTKAKAYMDKYGFRGCFSPIVNKIGTTNFMTLAQLQNMRDAGWEPTVHAYDINVHNNYAALDDSIVIADSLKAKAWMGSNGFGPAHNFIIPQGQITSSARQEAWRSNFTLVRTAYTRQRETYPPARAAGLRAYTMSQANNVAAVELKIDEAVANKEWLIFEIHDIVDSSPAQIDYLTTDFQTIVDYVNSSGIKVRTLNEVATTGVA